MKILYLHGIGSGANARTARMIQEAFPECKVIAPELPYSPLEARKYIWNIFMQESPEIVVGTSLGGFYTMLLGGCTKIIINPAMLPAINLESSLGLGTFPYFKSRSNGETEYTIDEEFLNQLNKLSDFFYLNCLDQEFKNETTCIMSTHDELFNNQDFYKEMYNKNPILINDKHRLSDKSITEVLIPLIRRKINELNRTLCNSLE